MAAQDKTRQRDPKKIIIKKNEMEQEWSTNKKGRSTFLPPFLIALTFLFLAAHNSFFFLCKTCFFFQFCGIGWFKNVFWFFLFLVCFFPVDVLFLFLFFLVLIPGVFGLFAVGGPSV